MSLDGNEIKLHIVDTVTEASIEQITKVLEEPKNLVVDRTIKEDGF